MLHDDRGVAAIAGEPLLVVGEEGVTRPDGGEGRASLGGHRALLELLAGVDSDVLRQGTLRGGAVRRNGRRQVAHAELGEVAAIEVERAVDQVAELRADRPAASDGVTFRVNDA